ncbi:uncharacterized protein CcaverHIS019_0204450 [Cutaneotrichosporon cavernicola]|uniref:DUF676 domain-containing protein n=1 Tax=Cutaneotrichosporon cavernicola TaxID=279322 RepID=A0AA48IFC6_9TREE|nr:uncharacterized protein CcaverHIS019_0204450 [Cutaneotrichosporon cavernicola]BEI89083.1 hypothetical protein CcaverHIS019_0204450 [Cutaneotrichosporon cavernicola]BEI96859.1 hypothetical protein CcaverHIS631_0204480 [Cutaneotrichosporon cavernicola]BEJ04631.1 hypothetical protein CcaverHIS641_0204480 [Cutaneotrichosporon cavernicola]
MTDEKETGAHKPDLLVLVWVHGFKGNDVTFEGFPSRIVRILEDTHPSLHVQSHVFPAYETRGELSAATENFVEWLATKVVQLENGSGRGRGAGSARVVLLGHSMGGLLIADATSRIADTTRIDDPMWPNVMATLAFDTPYLGLHPHVFKHGFSTAAGHVETARNAASALAMLSPLAAGFGFGKAKQAEEKQKREEEEARALGQRTPPQQSWWNAKAAVGLGAIAVAGAAAGTVYFRREDLATGWKWGAEHMTFVRNLWDKQAMRDRLDRITELQNSRNVSFANFYTCLPAGGSHLMRRTFAILPSPSEAIATHWMPATNSIAKDEVTAHMGMFNPRQNDGFYDLGLATARIIAERLQEEGIQRAGGVKGDAESVSEKMGPAVGSGTSDDPVLVDI